MSLHVTSEKEKDLQDLVEIVKSLEMSCHREYKPPKLENVEPVITSQPNNLRLSIINKKMKGWLKGTAVHKKYTDQLEKYENNQFYWYNKYKNGNITKEKLIKNLTELEKWFVCVIEPPPKKYKKDPIQVYMISLEQWLEREKTKYKNTRSYYCDDEVLSYIDKTQLFEIQGEIFDNYELVKTFYEKYDREYQKYLEKLRNKEKSKQQELEYQLFLQNQKKEKIKKKIGIC